MHLIRRVSRFRPILNRCFPIQTYGFRDLPTALYPDRSDGVTLACTRAQETAGYIYHQDGIDSLDRLSELCATVPVHCILGEKIDVV